MTKCMKCGVYIADNTDKCPLCQQVVAPVELSSDNHQGTEGDFEQHGTRYPDVKGASRKYRLLENIIILYIPKQPRLAYPIFSRFPAMFFCLYI